MLPEPWMNHGIDADDLCIERASCRAGVWEDLDVPGFGPDGAVCLSDIGVEIAGVGALRADDGGDRQGGIIDAWDGDAEGTWDGVGDFAWAAEAQGGHWCGGGFGHLDAAVGDRAHDGGGVLVAGHGCAEQVEGVVAMDDIDV
jgi:hypothetical protein